jgi:SOUL heme-binding protein
MKITFVIISIIFVLFIILQSFTIMSTNKAELQKYSVVHTEKEFEVRFYPSATFATIYSQAKTYQDLSGPGFRRLAGYIFGGNNKSQKISMTSPVQMDINDTLSQMSFVMPAQYTIEELPKPDDSSVVIHNKPDEYMAAIRFSGFASIKHIADYTEKLRNLLQSKGISYTGNFRYLGYNPPWQLIGRRNEIVVSVRWEGK